MTVKDSSIVMSMNWKLQSYMLFRASWNNKQDFVNAAKWCAKYGSAIRTVETAYQDSYFTWIFGKLTEIKQGTLNIFSVGKYGTKQPISLTSKICHIINPFDYPIIWDSQVRKNLKVEVKEKEKWKFEVKKHKQQNACRVELYFADSRLWAK